MMTVLTRSALRWLEQRRRRAEAQTLLERDARTLADIGLRRGAFRAALNAAAFESALDVAYRDSARLHATYAVH